MISVLLILMKMTIGTNDTVTVVEIKQIMFELFLLHVVRSVCFVFLYQWENGFVPCGFYSKAASIVFFFYQFVRFLSEKIRYPRKYEISSIACISY